MNAAVPSAILEIDTVRGRVAEPLSIVSRNPAQTSRRHGKMTGMVRRGARDNIEPPHHPLSERTNGRRAAVINLQKKGFEGKKWRGHGRARLAMAHPPNPNFFLPKIYLNYEIALHLTRKRLFPANGVELRIRPTCEACQVEKGNCWGRRRGSLRSQLR